MTLHCNECHEVRQWMIRWTSTSHTVDVDIEDGAAGNDGLLAAASEPILKTFIDSLSDGIIILDRTGKVFHLNRQGALILGQDQKRAIGRHISEIVDFRPVILDVLESGKGYLEREVYIQSPSRGKLRFIKSAIVLKDRKSRLIGVIDTFRLVESMNKLVPGSAKAKAKFSFSDIIGKEPVFLEALNLSRI